ncbi:MAG: AAA family ATPase [Proteobacteria bacterium]|nr:AAA family ATPase [Pseudomonadota bacterium]
MKIAISGAVSTGKTTLGTALAAALDLPFIEENLREMFGPGQAGQRTKADVATGLLQALETKRALESAQPGGFVIDRSPADILNFWFATQLAQHPRMQELYDRCATYLADYDAVVLLPWGVIALEPEVRVEDNIRRNTNAWAQLRGSVTISGLVHHFVAPERIVTIPKTVTTPDDRLRFVQDALAQISPR